MHMVYYFYNNLRKDRWDVNDVRSKTTYIWLTERGSHWGVINEVGSPVEKFLAISGKELTFKDEVSNKGLLTPVHFKEGVNRD